MKHKSLKIIFAFLTVVVVLFSFSLTIFASDQPSLFSFGYTYDDGNIYSGNTDVIITLGVTDVYTSDSFNLSSSINPLISYDLVEDGDELSIQYQYETDQIVYGSLEWFLSSFESTPNYFISDIVSDSSWFDCNFGLNSFSSSEDYVIDTITVSARDFYFYLDPNGDLYDPDFGGTFAESFITLEGYQDYSDGAEGTIYYCLAGQEDIAENRQVYNYSLSASETTSRWFETLPTDQSFSGTYSEPTLIYVEYFELVIPVAEPMLDGGINVSGIYNNYNMNYRNLDISSREDPISPMNPGIFRDYTGWLGTAVGGFLDLQIVDGFSLGGILMVLIAFMMAMWFLKVFAGG